ncbi:MAG TPA: hypothetical protein VJT31_16820 [Rugosimonospora sp.]|nr:hypothetical protein [Rugosimonospora sp.]
MSSTVTPPPRRRPELLIHLPGLRASLEEQRQVRLRQLGDLLAQEDRLARSRRMVGDETTSGLIDAVRQALGDIELALHRIHVGRYGTCLYCGSELPLALLRSAPQADACEDCG